MQHLQQRYKSAWETFTAVGKQDLIPENEITLSWQRSREYGLSSMGNRYIARCPSPQVVERLLGENRELLDIARPHIDAAYSTIKDSDVLISLANAEGYVLYVVGDGRMSASAAKNNIVIGANRSEKVVGTNAVGLAVLLKKHVQVHGYQHYNRCYHHLSCSSAPILDGDGQVAGTVNIVCGLESVHQHTLSLTQSLADIVATDKRLREKNEQLLKSNIYLEQVMRKTNQGVLIIDDRLTIVSCNEYAVSVMGEGLKDYVGKHIAEFFIAPLPKFFTARAKVNADVVLKTRTRNLWCTVEFNPIATDSGQPIGYILFFSEANRRNMDAHRIVGTRVYFRFSDMIGESPQLLKMIELATVAAASDTRILIQGESGTGKELFAQSIHNESAYRNGPFVPINCAAIPRELFESELFGYAAGSFTGAMKGGRPGKLETANHGTVFFDEIGDMPWDMQIKLLRVLQDNYVTRVGSSEELYLDIRYIFATNVDLEEKVASGQFRKDLFYRISVFTLKLPALRERRSDIPLLVASLVQKIGKRLNFPNCHITDDIMRLLVDYHWPGNVRQLENMVERLVLLSQGKTVTRDILPDVLLEPSAPGSVAGKSASTGQLAEVERRTIEEVLARNNGNITATAKVLGISRKTLYAKLREFGAWQPR